MPCGVYIEIIIGTLRVVTARELVILSGSFMPLSKSVRWHCHLRGHASHETVSVIEWGELKFHKPLSQQVLQPGRNATAELLLHSHHL